MHALPEELFHPSEPLRWVQPAATPYGTDEQGEPLAPEPRKPVRMQPFVQHVRLPLCGHKFAPGSQPRFANCESCWFAFFQVHGEVTQTADEVFQQYGPAALSDLCGKKFAQNFLKFMATVAQWKQQLETPEVKDTDAVPSLS